MSSTQPPSTSTEITISPDAAAVEGAEEDGFIKHRADIFLCLVINNLEEEPSNAHYQRLASATMDFYSDFLEGLHGTNLQKVEVAVKETKFRAGIPEEKYNIYVRWDIAVGFMDATKAPTKVEFCEALVNDIDMFAYLKDSIRTLTGTPFEDAIGLYTEQIKAPVK